MCGFVYAFYVSHIKASVYLDCSVADVCACNTEFRLQISFRGIVVRFPDFTKIFTL